MGFETESISQDAQLRLESLLPIIKSVKVELLNHEWTLFFTDTYQDSFFYRETGELKNDIFKELLQHVVVSCGQNTRKSIDVNTTPFTIAVLPSLFEIRLFSINLSDELFIVQELNKIKSPILDTKEFALLALHLEAGASVDVARFPTVIEELTQKHDLADLVVGETFEGVESESLVLTEKLVGHINNYVPGFFERASDFALGLTAEYALIRVHLLKFLAIFHPDK